MVRVLSRLIAAAARASARSQLLAGTAAFFILRLALTVPRTGPVVVADEVGYLTNARLLAGGVPGQLSTAPYYHGGYSLLLAPLLALDARPTTTYHLVLVLNTLLAASIAPLLYVLLTRCFTVAPRSAVWPSLAAAAYPSVTIYSQVALSENLLLPLFVLWLVCFGCFLRAETESRRIAWGSATAACAVWLWAAHGRMVVAIALTIAALLVLVVRRQAGASAAVISLAIVAAGIVAVHGLDHFLVTRNYGGHTPNEVDERLSTLESLGGIGAFLRNLVGQLWYLTVASLGVLVAATSPRVWTRVRRHRPLAPETVVLALAMLAGLGLLVESALSFRVAERADMIIYGRYTDVVLPPLVALALVRLGAGRRHHAVAAVATVAVATLATAALRTGIDPLRPANRWNVASLPSPTFGLGPPVLLTAGVVAAAVIAVVAVVQRRAPVAVAPLVLLLFLPTTVVAEHNPVLTAQSAFYPTGWTSPARAVDGARSVAFDTDGGGSVWVYQWFASKTRLVLFSGSAGRPPARLVFSSSAWAGEHPRLHATPLWDDASRDATLYRLGPAP
jgi:hypothetical protein